jgi:hypothetical protein
MTVNTPHTEAERRQGSGNQKNFLTPMAKVLPDYTPQKMKMGFDIIH